MRASSAGSAEHSQAAALTRRSGFARCGLGVEKVCVFLADICPADSRTGVPPVTPARRVAGQVRICRSPGARWCSGIGVHHSPARSTIGTAPSKYPAALRTARHPACQANPRESQHAAGSILQDGGQSGHARAGSASASTGLVAVDQVLVRADPGRLGCAHCLQIAVQMLPAPGR